MSKITASTGDRTLRAIALYLPQYHPIPENDRSWGKGFTEWNNVVKAQPLFEGHYQPHLPAELGFYDLRLGEVREAQAKLAREHGIHGFCYYHYWFNGRRVLQRPITEVLASGEPDFPFCFCWANENWTRRWDGLDHDIILKQEYSERDDLAHFRTLLPAFADPRYIRVDGKPLLLIYRITHLPNPERTIKLWRREAEKSGLPGLYLSNVESFAGEQQAGLLPLDAAVEFAPDWTCLGKRIERYDRQRPFFRKKRVEEVWARNSITPYLELRDNMLNKPVPEYLRFPCVTPMWDNTARRQTGATILIDSSPAAYEEWLTTVVRNFHPPTSEENFIFINAWNEWAEGNHLEPCQHWGRAYLEATRRALTEAPRTARRSGFQATPARNVR